MGAKLRSPISGVARQRTLKNPIGCRGTGLHCGDKVSLMMQPAPPDSGIRFRRTDIEGDEIAARIENVVEGAMATVLGNAGGATIGTVEHLLAALAGCGIDNATIEVDGPEIPILDGSAEPFVFLIESAGAAVQNAPRRFVEILRRVEVGDDTRLAALEPDDCFSVEFYIDFPDEAIGRQTSTIELVNGTFKHDIAPARTFGFAHHEQTLRAKGLALGASLENAIVIRDGSVVNEGGLRYDDEFVRHKILDCVGDLYLLGAPVIGHFEGYCSGHALNHELLRTLVADPDAWQYTTSASAETSRARPRRSQPRRASA